MPWLATLGALALKQGTPSVEGSRLGLGMRPRHFGDKITAVPSVPPPAKWPVSRWSDWLVQGSLSNEEILQQSVPISGRKRKATAPTFDFHFLRLNRRWRDRHDFIFRPTAWTFKRYRLRRTHSQAPTWSSPGGNALTPRARESCFLRPKICDFAPYVVSATYTNG
jgi:hypothetical protein